MYNPIKYCVEQLNILLNISERKFTFCNSMKSFIDLKNLSLKQNIFNISNKYFMERTKYFIEHKKP